MCKIYGYCRISTKQQSIERQERNIKTVYPDAIIIKESFSGTKIDRPEFTKLLKVIKENDTIVFDSVSRMSRNEIDGTKLYFELYDKGVNLVFLKEGYINTDTYKNAIKSRIDLIGTKEDILLKAINEYLQELAKEQIKIAFEQAQKEVDDLHQRTKEGIETARLNGKQIGGVKGKSLTTKKSIQAKEQIKKYSKDFDGTLNDIECMKMVSLARNTFYKYKKELLNESNN